MNRKTVENSREVVFEIWDLLSYTTFFRKQNDSHELLKLGDHLEWNTAEGKTFVIKVEEK